MLHFPTGLVVVPPCGLFRLVTDAVSTTVRGQGRIRDQGALGYELLVDANELALAVVDQLHDLVMMGLGFLCAVEGRDPDGASSDNLFRRVAGDAKHAGDRPFAVTRFV